MMVKSTPATMSLTAFCSSCRRASLSVAAPSPLSLLFVAVIAIRGTLSLEDCLTDFMCEPAALNDWIAGAPGSDNPSSFDDDTPTVQLASRGNTITAHAGILSAAKAVVQDLQVRPFPPRPPLPSCPTMQG